MQGRLFAVRAPYGPAKGTIEAVRLLSRLSPTRLDEAFLRQHNIAPRNEYKVVGALRFLGLIDQDGRPTSLADRLKARGPTYSLNLQEVIRSAYGTLWQRLNPQEASREEIYNYFVTHEGLGAEMASKAVRFFVDICHLAEMPLSPGLKLRPGRVPAGSAPSGSPQPAGAREPSRGLAAPGSGPGLVVALSPETARLSEEELTDLFRRLRRAWQRSEAK